MVRPQVISRTMQSYLQALSEQMHHYATLRLFDGMESRLEGRLCLDAQVPVLLTDTDQEYDCCLVALASYRKEDLYRQELLRLECHYNPVEVMALGPARWGQATDMLAYQLIGQLVQWKKDKDAVAYSYIASTTGLKPNHQRFYL